MAFVPVPLGGAEPAVLSIPLAVRQRELQATLDQLDRAMKLSALGFLATVAIIALLTGVAFWFLVRVRIRLPLVPLWVTFPIAWTTLDTGVLAPARMFVAVRAMAPVAAKPPKNGDRMLPIP